MRCGPQPIATTIEGLVMTTPSPFNSGPDLGARAPDAPSFPQASTPVDQVTLLRVAQQPVYGQPEHGQPAPRLQPAFGQGATRPHKQWIVALLWRSSSGIFGIHNFYLGYTKGIIQLICPIASWSVSCGHLGLR